jgi:porphobilinogen synthase
MSIVFTDIIPPMAGKPPEHRPVIRPRRLRRGALLRDAVADVRLTPGDLVMPIFVRQGQGIRRPVSSMPGVAQLSPDVALQVIRDAASAGIQQFIVFGVTESDKKDAHGSAALDRANPVNDTLRRVRDAGLDVLLYADLCFCEYTDHGHCGVLHKDASIGVDNDKTLELLGRQATVLAASGADVVAPSGMMDGQVGAIRSALDAGGFEQTAILAYSIKYASSLYGPFREAGEGAPGLGDRRGYQMDYRRSREWRTELRLDLAEGADMVMVKPAATYLDIIRQVRDATDVPLAAYHVSGEYAMLHAAADKGWLDLQAAALETTCAIKRAGADLILTYFAPQLVQWL